MKELDLETMKELKKISHSCLDLIAQMRQAKTKLELLDAGKTLSCINYSLLYIIKQHEMEAINLLDEIEYINDEEDN